MKNAAVSLCERENGELLVVWNKRYTGWTLPGGLVEPGETIQEAQERELAEETGLRTYVATLIYDEEAAATPSQIGRASHVYVFRVLWHGTPLERERGGAVTWFTREEFLASCPFASFYRTMFERLR